MDSDVEVVQDSAGEENNDIPLGSDSGSDSPLSSLPSHFPGRGATAAAAKGRRVDRSSPLLSTHQNTKTAVKVSVGSSKYKPSSKLVACDTSSSDVELISGPSAAAIGIVASSRAAGKDLTNKLRLPHPYSTYGSSKASTSELDNAKSKKTLSTSSSSNGVFKSAATLLKEEVKKEKLRQRSSSSASSSGSESGKAGAGSRSHSHAARASTLSCKDSVDVNGKGKGKGREGSLPPALSRYFTAGSAADDVDTARQLEDEDDEVLELPPPLSSRLTGTTKTSISTASHATQGKEVDLEDNAAAIEEAIDSSPGTTFRNRVNKFKAPVPSKSTSASTGSSSRARILLRGSGASAAPPSSLFTSHRRSESVSEAISLSTGSDSAASSSASAAALVGRSRKSTRAPSGSASCSTSAQLSIPAPFLALIKHCPVCDALWTVTKDSKSKLSHIRKCAAQRLYSNGVVNDLVEAQIRAQQAEQEVEARKLHSEKTLFEGVVSRKGKEVNVVGVEKKTRKNNVRGTDGVADTDDKGQRLAEEGHHHHAVLYTQGGSALSQATSTQVQKDLHKRIKNNQRLDRGAFVPVSAAGGGLKQQLRAAPVAAKGGENTATSGSGSEAELQKSRAHPAALAEEAKQRAVHDLGVGSKNWLKAAKLLKAKDKEVAAPTTAALLSATYIGASISSTLGTASSGGGAKRSGARNHLEPFSASRFRLSAKLNELAASRAYPSERHEAGQSYKSGDGNNDTRASWNDRPHRNPSNLDISLLDRAIGRGEEKLRTGYDAWRLAGSDEDPIRDRMVPSSPPSSPLPTPLKRHHSPLSDGSDSDGSVPPISRPANHRTTAQPMYTPAPVPSTQLDGSMHAALPDRPRSPAVADLPPIDNLSLISRPASSLDQHLDALHITSELNSSILETTFMHAPDTFRVHDAPISADANAAPTASTSTATAVSGRTAPRGGNGPHDSSSALFKSSAALHALTQKMKSSSSVRTTATLSFQSVKSGVQQSRPALQLKPSRTETSAQLSSNYRQPLPLLLSSEALPSVSNSPGHPVQRSFATSSGAHLPATMLSSNGALSDEDGAESKEHGTVVTGNAHDTSEVKKPRGRPRKIVVVEIESPAIAKSNASPKRKKLPQQESSDLDVESSLNGIVDPSSPSPRKKKAPNKPAKDRKPPVTTKASSMPDYESWSKEELQAETGKYGYKPAGTKKVLIDQLVRVWKAIHPEEDAASSSPSKAEEKVPPWRARSRSSSVSSLPSSPAKKSRPAKKAAADNDLPLAATKARKKAATTTVRQTKVKSKATASTSSATAKSKAIAAARAKRNAAALSSGELGSDGDPDDELSNVHANDLVREDEIDTEAEPDEIKTAGERLRSAILGDEKFYLRILRYEPILFDDFELLATSIGVKMSKVALRDWLDSQGIIFYYDQTTGRNAKRNGARRRHA